MHQLKNESKIEVFSVPGNAQEIANRTKINTLDVLLMTHYWVHLIIHLELHLKVYFKIYMNKENKEMHLMRLH